MAIISMAQQASPRGMGHSEFLRLQPTAAWNVVVSTEPWTFSSGTPVRRAVGGIVSSFFMRLLRRGTTGSGRCAAPICCAAAGLPAA